jgi:two-component system chemotaxis response regulator CheY
MRILVVDDEFVSLTKMIALLSSYGPCDAATHGEQAIQMYSEACATGQPYGLVIMDIEMPGMDGIQTLHTICQREQLRQMPRARKIVISAASSRENVRRAAEQGCDAFMVKPVSKDNLVSILSKLGIEAAPAAPAR